MNIDEIKKSDLAIYSEKKFPECIERRWWH